MDMECKCTQNTYIDIFGKQEGMEKNRQVFSILPTTLV
jgi:hypothetical protein